MADQLQPKLFGKFHELVLLLLTFLLTTVLGGVIGEKLQERSWTHQHLIQVCEIERENRNKWLTEISDLMDRRLLAMRKLAWKLEGAHSLKDIEEERKKNLDARDEWAMRLNSNLWFAETNFGPDARNTLEQEIGGGFNKIYSDFNDLVKRNAPDKEAARRIESEIDDFNPTIYVFDLKMEKIAMDKATLCSTLP